MSVRNDFHQVLVGGEIQKICKSSAWCIKYSRKINRITQIDCKSRDESNEPNYDVIRH